MTTERLTIDLQEEVLEEFSRDRHLAHDLLFAHRHPVATAPFQLEMIDLIHSRDTLACIVAFRDSAKSTYAEEAVVLMACLREFSHGLIVGTSLDKACERLHSIRRQFERNAQLRLAFGDLVGQPWGDEDIELTSGIRIQAMGRNQAIRGTKAEDFRPDFILCDDIEDRQSLSTVDGREKVQNWFFDELLPSGDRQRLRVRVLANDMHIECLANVLERPNSGWTVRRYPCLFKNDKGEDEATWPASFPLDAIAAMRARMYAVGRGDEFEQNYMCRSTTPAQRLFKRDMIRVTPTVRTWQAVYGAYDPARTVSRSAADTGHARWSWIGNRLVVWEAWGKQLLPDEIVKTIYDDDADIEIGRYTRIGVDEAGLSEFLMQPLRQEGLKRGVALPIQPLKLRTAKSERIKGLQPWFIAHEVYLVKALPDLESQLVNYPTGKVDILDCLACALLMKPGQPVYEDFTTANVADAPEIGPGQCFLAFNAKPSYVTAALAQYREGRLTIYRDWVREGDPSDLIRAICEETRLETQSTARLVLGPQHYDKFTNVGILQSCKRLMLDTRKGSAAGIGREQVRQFLRKQSKGLPSFLVSSQARWTLNGFSAGFARGADKRTGALLDEPEDNEYRTLIEGIESFAGLVSLGVDDVTEAANSGKQYAATSDGRRYISALPHR